jgi:hypothetical protein
MRIHPKVREGELPMRVARTSRTFTGKGFACSSQLFIKVPEFWKKILLLFVDTYAILLFNNRKIL